jgi:anti-sigma28 factor (negative regulator of flagellin synthesis)
MITQANSSSVRATYASNTADTKITKSKLSTTQESGTSKIEQLKESINSGEYKVNIESLSEKMADSLL